MSGEAWVTLAIVLGMVVLLVRDVVPPVLAVLGANIALLVAGVTTTEQAFMGFANPAPITVAALFVIARAVEKTGALEPLLVRTLGHRQVGRAALARLLAPVAGASAFLNNTPIVAMLAPQVAEWADKRGCSASGFLMPLSFATILGGTMTLVGTSTNLVVSGLMEAEGLAPMGMFEISAVGVPVTLIGLLCLVALAPVLVPERRTARRQFTDDLREFVCTATVEPGGALDGRTVEEGGLRHLQGVFLVEIRRGNETIAPVAPTTTLRGGDRLTFAGRVDMVRDLQRLRGLVSTEHRHALAFDGPQHTFFETVVSGASSLIGKTLREVSFRSRYQAAVMGIHRAGARVNDKLGSVRLKEGDTLLLVSDRDFARRWRDRNEFLLVSHLGGSPPPGTRKASIVGLTTLAVIGFAALGVLPILHTALLGAFFMVVAGVLTPGEARGAINMDVIVLIAAAFGIGAAIQSSGLASLLGAAIVDGFSGFGPLGVLLAVIVATIILTEVVTNNAAAVLVFPIAVAAAAEIGADPRPFAIAVAIAASASFLTPIGYQTNTMVFGPGGYRFTDYARLGAPLTVVVVIVTALVVPWVWPFVSG